MDTVGDDDRSEELKIIFERELPVGKEFSDKEAAKLFIQKLSRTQNIPFETHKSDKVYIKLTCRHFGVYRPAKKGNTEENVIVGKLATLVY